MKQRLAALKIFREEIWKSKVDQNQSGDQTNWLTESPDKILADGGVDVSAASSGNYPSGTNGEGSLLSADTASAVLEEVGATAEKVSPLYKTQYEKYVSLARRNIDEAARLTWDIFTDTGLEDIPSLRSQQALARNSANYYMDFAEKMEPKIKFWGSSAVRNMDTFGTGIDVALSVDDVLNAPTKEEAEKRAFVDSWGIAGGEYGGKIGVELAVAEEVESVGILTPLALVTGIGGNAIGTYIGKSFGTFIWDVSEMEEKEGQKWTWKK